MKTSPQQSFNLSSKSSSDRVFDTTSFILNSNSSSNLSMRKNQPTFDNLSDILMNKAGPYNYIGYLGSAILTKGKTGLGCLQQPLRDLYCIFRKNGSRLMQERRLVVSIDGLTMLYSDQGIEKFVHNDLNSVYDVQLLYLVSDGKKDKQKFAFLPFNESETNLKYLNLYQSIDKQFLPYIENITHPPIIALIMRRSSGIQALECHVIITRNSSDAIRIVNDIKKVCSRYKHELSQHTQVFDYRLDNQELNSIEKKSKNFSQLPPKSPKVKNEEVIIYDAFKENNDSNIQSSSKSSFFDRIKKCNRDKSTDAKTKKSLNSSSEIIFDKKEIDKSKKSTSSLGNFNDSDKNSSKKSLKQSSFNSLNQAEKKSKKQSLGKRIINSARSSLKSNSSKNKDLKSNSAVSLNSGVADVDFRKSKTTMLSDNLLIDKSSAMSHVIVQPSPTLSRPTNICLENRINFIPPSPNLTSTRRENLTKSRSKIAPSPNQLLIPELRSSSKTHLENTINFTKLEEAKYQKKVLNLPVSDPKLLSNHLVWNKQIGTAESLDKELLTSKIKILSPIAKVRSQGGLNFDDLNTNLNTKNENRINYHEENRFRSKSQSNGMVFRPKVPTSIIPEINYTSLKEHQINSHSHFHDSAYGSCHESSKLSEPLPEPKGEVTNLKSQNLVLNRLKQQYEQELEKKSKLSVTSHKIVGGVKVFPTLPQEFRLNAEMRQKRLAEIESNLNKTHNEYQFRQKSQFNEINSSFKEFKEDEDDQEIIDLTMNREEINESKLNTSFKEIPIQIMTNKIENCETHEDTNTKSFVQSFKYDKYVKDSEDVETKLDNFNHIQQANFIYYYDNEQFAGY
ncbi:unnamed protein product [Brachionus calyciflorus]|uniref:PID domain-containing protein n=1 Tax=Brachionus calyciflorus TaxID=104777 RepID=A0A813M333_9BILA|nr:unnamed protein product [Brachionus calyciflorus]